jgi:hypothetical protein
MYIFWLIKCIIFVNNAGAGYFGFCGSLVVNGIRGTSVKSGIEMCKEAVCSDVNEAGHVWEGEMG